MRWLYRKLKARGTPTCRHCDYPLQPHEQAEGACDACLHSHSWPTGIVNLERSYDGPIDIPRLGDSIHFQHTVNKTLKGRR